MGQLKGPILMDNDRLREEIKNVNLRLLNSQRDLATEKNRADTLRTTIRNSAEQLDAMRARATWLSVIAGTSVALNVFLIALHRIS